MRFHHIGHVVPSLDEARADYAALGFEPSSAVFVDEAQRVRVQFVDAGGVCVELVEPLDEQSPVAAAAARGGGLAHLCYEVDDLDEASSGLRGRGYLPLGAATPAPAFDGRRVAFFASANRHVIELVETGD